MDPDRSGGENTTKEYGIVSDIRFIYSLCLHYRAIRCHSIVSYYAGNFFLCKGKRALFVAAFALAIPIKMFAFLPFLILLLYTEKNIMRILVDIACGLYPTIMMRMLIPFSEGSNTGTFIPALFTNKTPLSYNGIYIFLVAFTVLCFIAYIQKPAEDVKQFGRDVAYLCFFSYAIIFVLGYTLPYWFFYMAPFMYWIIANNWENHPINLLAELGISFFPSLHMPWHTIGCFPRQLPVAICC